MLLRSAWQHAHELAFSSSQFKKKKLLQLVAVHLRCSLGADTLQLRPHNRNSDTETIGRQWHNI